jgi:hypothetical protein
MNNSLTWFFSGIGVLGLSYILTLNVKHSKSSPIRVIGWSWALMFFLSATQIIQFPEPSVKALLYLLSFPCLIMVGAAVPSWVKRETNSRMASPGHLRNPAATSRNFQIFFLFGMVGLATELLSRFQFSSVGGTISDLRNVVFALEYQGRMNWLSRTALLTFSFTWIAFVISLLFGERLNAFQRRLGYIFAFGLILYGVTTLGRTVMLRETLILFCCTLVRRDLGRAYFPWRWTTFRAWLVVILVVLGGIYSLAIWGFRSGGADRVSETPETFFSNTQSSLLLKKIRELVPQYFAGTVNLVPIYTATLADNFCSFYDGPDIDPLYGMWQLWGLSTALNRRGVPVAPAVELYEYVETTDSLAGITAAQWRTMAQEFIIDFGKVGALIMAVVTGLFFGWVHKQFAARGEHWGVVLIIVDYWAIYSAGTSPFNIEQLVLLACGLCFTFYIRAASPARPKVFPRVKQSV